MNFQQKLTKTIKANNSLVCVGLDPDIDKLPTSLKQQKLPLTTFNKAIIDATHDLVACYKPNIAFYEAYGLEGLEQLKKTIEFIQLKYPQTPVILDAKRGDIGNTSKMYAKAVFDYWQIDAVTVYPYPGLDALQPFFDYQDKTTFLLIRTSNPDAKMFQDLLVDGEPYYLAIAKKIKAWNFNNMGIFVGATYPQELKKLRIIFPDKIFLSAGIGAQAGEIKQAVESGIDNKGAGIIFNASRSILYASDGKDFAQEAREATRKLKEEINKYR